MAKISKPLTRLLKKDAPFIWNAETQLAFQSLRDIICTKPLLQFPNFKQPFLLTTDASNYALGAVLSQGSIGQDFPIAYASRTLSDSEVKYSTIEKELLAVLFAVEHFRPYLYGHQFTLVTNHRPLVWLHNVKDPTSKIMRWRIKLNEHDYNIVYKPGKQNSNADALSRNPSNSTEFDQTSIALIKHTETDNPDVFPMECLREVVTGASESPIAASGEVNADRDRSLEYKSEKLIANVFHINGKTIMMIKRMRPHLN